MTDWVYVDNSNVWIEGQRVSAVRQGMALSITDALNRRIFDFNYRMSFGKLYQHITGGDKPGRAMLFGSRPPENDAIWNMANKAGFEVRVFDRNAANREKKIDTGIVAEMVKDCFTGAAKGDTFTLVAGDGDYLPAIEMIKTAGMVVDVVFWSHASGELKRAASKFVDLDPMLNLLRI